MGSGPTVALQGLAISDPLSAAIVADDERVMVIDGLSATSDQVPTTRAWVAPLADAESATPLDLSGMGPRAALTAAWWNEEAVVAGRQCPGILDFRGAEPQAELQQVCGSTVADVFAVHPDTGEVRLVVGPVEIGADEHLRILATSEDELLLQHGTTTEVITVGGERRSVAAPPEDAPESVEPGFVCELGGRFHGVSVGPGGAQDPPLPVAAHVSVSVLEGEGWRSVTLPAGGLETQQVFPLGCSTEGLTLASVDLEREGLELGRSTSRVHAIDRTDDGELTLRTLPTDGLPGAVDALHARLIGEQIIASYLEPDSSTSQTFLWEDPSWTLLEGRSDMSGYTWTPHVFGAVLVEASRVLRMADSSGDLLRRPFDGPSTSIVVE